MKKHFIFFILSRVLLIKPSLGDLEANSRSNELTSNGKAFRNAAIEKFAILTEEPIKLGHNLYRDTIADKTNSENVNEMLNYSLSGLEKINWNEPAGRVEVFLGFNFMFDVLRGHVNITDEGRKDLIIAVKEAFEKHDLVGVANEFQRKFDEFLEWLTLELKAHTEKLTLEEQLWVKEFKELCLEFKSETNMSKKDDEIRALIRSVRLQSVKE